MKSRAFQDKKRYLWAFVIGTLLFLLVFLMTYLVSYVEFQRISNMQTNLAYGIFSHKLNYTFFDGKICTSDFYNRLTNDFNFQRSVIYDLEKKLGKNNGAVIERKKFYTLIEIEHFEFIQKLNEECGRGIDTILFFYSNEEPALQKSEDAGKVLDIVFNKNPDNLIIYSFDINLESELIASLKEKYNVIISPTIMVNDKMIVNPANILDIEEYLK